MNDFYVILLFTVVILWFVLAGVGAYVSEQKGRNAWEGALLALFLGPIGCIIAGLLPTMEEAGEGQKKRTYVEARPDVQPKPKPQTKREKQSFSDWVADELDSD